MSTQFYSPNKKVTGGALMCSFNSKEEDISLKFVKQVNNNPDKKNFDWQQYIVFKLTLDEAADIIRCVRSRETTSFFHTYTKDGNETKTTGNFNYYEIQPTEPGKKVVKGFGFSVKRGDLEVKVGLGLAGGERLSLWLQNVLVRVFDAAHAADIERAKEYKKNKEATAAKPKAEPTAKPVDAPLEAPDEVDDVAF